MTIDNAARESLSRAFEQYLDGSIDSVELHQVLVRTSRRDTACYEFYLVMVDALYSLSYRHKNMHDAELTPRQQQMLQRWIGFLRTLEEWPATSTFHLFWPWRICAEVFRALREFAGSKSRLENEYWPFASGVAWSRFAVKDLPDQHRITTE